MGLFKKPEQTKTGLKALVFGASGSGKTTFSLSFPEVAALDSEAGMGYYRNNPNLQAILLTTSAEEVEEALEEIEDELVNSIKTFVLDSETKIYENMQHSALELVERRARSKGQDVQDANLSQREWGKIKLINKRIQSTKIKLSSLGINIVSVAQEKEIKEKRGDNWVVVGHEPDTAKGMAFDYDIVLRLYTEESKDGEVKYFGKVTKDRTQTFKRGTVIENPSFDNWAKVVDGNAKLKTEVIDFKKDIATDTELIEAEFEKIESIQAQIKDFMESCKESGQTEKLKPLLLKTKKLGLTNPTKVTDVEQAKELLELCK